jgi:hypothetical protein
MKVLSIRRLGWVLVFLGLFAEVMAIVAHRASQDVTPGSFTSLVSFEMVAAAVILVIGAVLVWRGKPGS